jgi:hypothetical protein
VISPQFVQLVGDVWKIGDIAVEQAEEMDGRVSVMLREAVERVEDAAVSPSCCWRPLSELTMQRFLSRGWKTEDANEGVVADSEEVQEAMARV